MVRVMPALAASLSGDSPLVCEQRWQPRLRGWFGVSCPRTRGFGLWVRVAVCAGGARVQELRNLLLIRQRDAFNWRRHQCRAGSGSQAERNVLVSCTG